MVVVDDVVDPGGRAPERHQLAVDGLDLGQQDGAGRTTQVHAPAMESSHPETFEKLSREPGFILFKLRKAQRDWNRN